MGIANMLLEFRAISTEAIVRNTGKTKDAMLFG